MSSPKIKISNLEIMVWNCNSVTQNIQKLTTFIKLHNISMVLLGETQFHLKTPLNISNFHVYRSDRQPLPRHPPNGGTMVLIRYGIVH